MKSMRFVKIVVKFFIDVSKKFFLDVLIII